MKLPNQSAPVNRVPCAMPVNSVIVASFWGWVAVAAVAAAAVVVGAMMGDANDPALNIKDKTPHNV